MRKTFNTVAFIATWGGFVLLTFLPDVDDATLIKCGFFGLYFAVIYHLENKQCK